MIPRILVIAGSDSGGGAGIQADIKTITMLGGHAMTAITAVTAQNTLGVARVDVLPVDAVVAQIDAVVGDIGVDAVKIGMLGSAEIARAVADRLGALHAVPIVFDPVMVATSGATLADPATVAAFERLMTIAAVVTPNAPELAVLGGAAVADRDDLEAAAVRLHGRLGCAVLAKGGHLPDAGEVTDLVVTGEGTRRFASPRIETRHNHGTGCTLASGVATGLAAGLPLAAAVERARAYVHAALLAAPGLGGGHGPMGHGLGRAPFDGPDPSPPS